MACGGLAGPVTPEGKRRSSRNALRHGILAETVVLDDENRQAFDEFMQGVGADLQPQGTVESSPVDSFAVARRRQMRIWAVEQAIFCDSGARPSNPAADPAVRAAILFRNLADNFRVLDLLGRYESRFDRQSARALNQLLRLRTLPRPQPAEPAPPSPPPPAPAQPPAPVAPEPAADTKSAKRPTSPLPSIAVPARGSDTTPLGTPGFIPAAGRRSAPESVPVHPRRSYHSVSVML